MNLPIFFMQINDKYNLELNFNALIRFEELTGIKISNIAEAFQSMKTIRTLVFCMLQKHHSKEFKNEDLAGDFIDELGGIQKITEIISKILSESFGNEEEEGKQIVSSLLENVES